jgi:thiamine kinase-like enzyme
VDRKIKDLIISKVQSKNLVSEELIQNLWSGYGNLSRMVLDNKSIIVKEINYPSHENHPKGWNSKRSHERKIKSYEVEKCWYKSHNSLNKDAYSPRYLFDLKNSNCSYLVLEDLKEKGFISKSQLNWNETKSCLKWLSTFHAMNLGASLNGLWKTGTYWHLETRPDEFDALNDDELKSTAAVIDKKLKASRFQTIVHGDAKIANFLFNSKSACAVDFQYVGGGVGVKDLAYFLSSIYSSNELFENEQKCLKYYFEELIKSLKIFHPEINYTELEKEWRYLYPYAWADFIRFLKGWSPDHYKINAYSSNMRQKVLDEIK